MRWTEQCTLDAVTVCTHLKLQSPSRRLYEYIASPVPTGEANWVTASEKDVIILSYYPLVLYNCITNAKEENLNTHSHTQLI